MVLLIKWRIVSAITEAFVFSSSSITMHLSSRASIGPVASPELARQGRVTDHIEHQRTQMCPALVLDRYTWSIFECTKNSIGAVVFHDDFRSQEVSG